MVRHQSSSKVSLNLMIFVRDTLVTVTSSLLLLHLLNGQTESASSSLKISQTSSDAIKFVSATRVNGKKSSSMNSFLVSLLLEVLPSPRATRENSGSFFLKKLGLRLMDPTTVSKQVWLVNVSTISLVHLPKHSGSMKLTPTTAFGISWLLVKRITTQWPVVQPMQLKRVNSIKSASSVDMLTHYLVPMKSLTKATQSDSWSWETHGEKRNGTEIGETVIPNSTSSLHRISRSSTSWNVLATVSQMMVFSSWNTLNSENTTLMLRFAMSMMTLNTLHWSLLLKRMLANSSSWRSILEADTS